MTTRLPKTLKEKSDELREAGWTTWNATVTVWQSPDRQHVVMGAENAWKLMLKNQGRSREIE